MSTSPSREPAAPIKTPVPVPVAYPPAPAAGRRPRLPRVVLPLRDEPGGSWFASFWTAESLKGWAGSVSLHVVLLTCLGLWYLAPPLRENVAFDTRLGGSVNGVPEGDMLKGGLNTPEDVQGIPEKLFESEVTLQPLIQLAQPTLEPMVGVGRGANPSAGGGAPNQIGGRGTATASGSPGSATAANWCAGSP